MPKPCPICRNPVGDTSPWPFCSDRCRRADLARWLDGGWAIPGDPVPSEDEDQDGRKR
jgi:endogenous inhibitor of DNA gyrase (YacG/DUF329 family)